MINICLTQEEANICYIQLIGRCDDFDHMIKEAAESVPPNTKRIVELATAKEQMKSVIEKLGKAGARL